MALAGAGATQRARMEQWGMPVLAGAMAALAWAVAPLPAANPMPQWSLWLAIAVVLGLAAPLWEIALGYGNALIRRQRVNRVALHGYAPSRFGAVASVCVVAACEELIFRRIGIDLLVSNLAWPVWAAIAITSVFYGLNHLYFGWLTVSQKILTGAVYGALYVISGHALLVPLVAHVVHNIVVLTIVPRWGGRA